MLLTDKYADKIYGTITCYDRMIIQGYISGWSYADGMTSYLKSHDIRIFDFSNFSQPLTEQVLTVFRRPSPNQEKQRGLSIYFLPWSNAIPINHGMIKLLERHFSNSIRASVSIITFIS